ncbi:MAG TPA: metal-dependent hydrolase [Polyangiaceae bacterium]|nr:metal-dependent hydrolase [Polyangiaceae bacterium]
MPSIGHVAVGLAAARLASSTAGIPVPRIRLALLLSAAALLPDLDAIGFELGVPYGAPWGHRGAAHSLVFAAIVGVLVAPLGRQFKLSSAQLWLWVTCATASHGLLDSLTNGGRGIALLWPFTHARFFAPWRPIAVAPLGLRVLSARGVYVVGQELLLFAPLFIYGLWPRRGNKPS